MLGKPKANRVTIEYTGDDANGVIGNGCGCLPVIEIVLLFIAFVLVAVYWQ